MLKISGKWFVFVHPKTCSKHDACQKGQSNPADHVEYVVSCIDANGKWHASITNGMSKEDAQRAASKQRKLLRRLHS